MSSKKFSVIVVDPPWTFGDKINMTDTPRGAAANYNTMSMSEIKALPINSIADPDGALLALWVPSSLLQDGMDIMSAWGFKQKQTYVWVKIIKEPLLKIIKEMSNGFLNKEYSFNNILQFGMGRIFRQCHEICLIGTNSNKIYKKLNNKSQRSVSFGTNLKHSSKPEHLQNSLDLMFPDANKIELFARRVRQNWDCLGDAVCEGEDILVSLSKL